MLKNLCEKYFELFSKKDINSLSKLFSNDISLIDWEIKEVGKENVIKANKKIFNSVDSINVIPQKINVNKNVAMCMIKIVINQDLDDEDHLKVIDVITFNDSNLITEISAYKQ